MRTAHTFLGLAFVAVFLGTGAYMRLRFPDAYLGDAGMRLMFRSAHVYILLAALLNLVLGAYLRVGEQRLLARMQHLGSFSILFSPAAFTLAFFLEPSPARLDRPYSFVGLVLALLGALLHAIAGYRSHRRGDATDSA